MCNHNVGGKDKRKINQPKNKHNTQLKVFMALPFVSGLFNGCQLCLI